MRYKDDVYDRLWSAYGDSNIWKPLGTNVSDGQFINKNKYQLPFTVMRTAYTDNNESDMILTWHQHQLNSTSEYFLVIHLSELERLQKSQFREFDIYVNENLWYGPLVPSYLETISIFSTNGTKVDSEGKFQVSFNPTKNSTLAPLINAMEIYILKELSLQETNQTQGTYMYVDLRNLFLVLNFLIS
ncbi:Malectin-like carbohydrate-binding domain containing protein [Trema orientale]|uniref:Malectin-like carbohydrate-binding domain containing protein n=1 Tax=Trema orientale TaxID=63057 RepID=A0A2P5EFK6_TREOI|nr:Malectin-like carbohydrate-binding domain containing protein [Trema orientale]